MKTLSGQLRKAFVATQSSRGRHALRLGVAATGEHQPVLARLRPATVIDIGANRGQFALDVYATLPETRVLSFEPMRGAADVYRQVFAGDDRFQIEQVALGAETGVAELHVSQHDDSSSLLAIGDGQVSLFPGTGQSGVESVTVTRLDDAIQVTDDLVSPILLKVDVQGFELEVFRGAVKLLAQIDWVYVECSFEELYENQPLAHEVVEWLHQHHFRLCGIGSISTVERRIVQADLLFERVSPR